ncbi:MAG: ADP-ribosylation factor-like protein [Promethearchaeota archaeon]
MITKDGKGKKKLLVVGLDDAGKTSIVSLVRNKMIDALSSDPVVGTHSNKTELLGNDIIIQDLGGQNNSNIQYLEDPKFFAGTDVFIFVFDLQDVDRYDLALEYYEASMDIISKMEKIPLVFVFFHKFDGDYKEDYKDMTTRVRVDFARLRDAVLAASKAFGINIEDIFQTTIFDEWTCYGAFNSIWVRAVPVVESMQNYLQELVDKNEEVGIALLLDIDSNILAKAFSYKEEVELDSLVEIAARSITILLDWQRTISQSKVEDTDFAIVEIEDHSIMLQKIRTSFQDFFLAIYAIGGNYKILQTRFAEISFSLENILKGTKSM